MKNIAVLCFLLAARFLSASDIVINEIMYHHPSTDLEFVELYNASGSDVNLQDWYLLDDNDGHAHCRLTGTLRAGGYLVVAGNAALFTAAYPGVSPVNTNTFATGTNAWTFGNAGDAVRLFTAAGVLHDIVTYADGGDWPGPPDGKGPSLELMNPGFDNALPSSWRASSANGGTPGRINSVYTVDAAPVCRDGKRLTDLPAASDAVTVSVTAFDVEGPVSVRLMVDTGAGYAPLAMNDNGTGGDSAAGDSLYSAVIPAQPGGSLVRYYAVATDNAGQTDKWPKQAPDEYHAYTVDYRPPKLRITELMAANTHTAYDAFGDSDDWFEIHNEEGTPVNVGGMFVTASFKSPRKFQLPARTLAPDDYLLVWADNETAQGALHANFKLSAVGEEIGIFESVNHGNVMIHGWKYGLMGEDISMGFLPADATAPEYLSTPTPDAPNASSKVYSPVCINEFQSTSDFGGPDDWVELYNRGTTAYNLSGCYLSDERANNTKWTFPQGAILQPGGFLVVYEDALKFGWSSAGDDVIMLTAADSTTGLDFYDFGPQTPDRSEGRMPDGVAVWTFFNAPTKGSANPRTAVQERDPLHSPAKMTLFQNYPNPFNPETSVGFYLPHSAKVRLSICDIRGRVTETLFNGLLNSGSHRLVWNAAGLPSGVYVAVLSTPWGMEKKKMTLVR
jgi:hypothetical protein